MSAPAATGLPLDRGVPPRRLVASAPLVLDHPGQAWFLTTGEVDLFVVPTDERGRTGRRTHMATAGAGTLLVGAAPLLTDGQTWRLTAVGVDAAALPLADDWVASAATSPVVQQGLHAWLTVTGSALDAVGTRRAVSSEGTARPGGSEGFDESEPAVLLSEGEVVNAPGGLLWLLAGDAVLALGGRALTSPPPIPLGAAFDITVHHTGRGRLRSTGELSAPEIASGLESIQQDTMRAYAALAADRWQVRALRRATQREADAVTRAYAHTSLQRIGGRDRWVASPSDETVLTACRLLGARTGIAVKAPPDWSERVRPDPVRAIARASGVRVREVSLDGDWWRQGADAVIAFRAGDEGPVVLVPGPSGGYRLTDPGTMQTSAATAATAVGLHPKGYVFYRPLPDGPITIAGLLRFGFSGSRRDVAKLLGYSLLIGLLTLAIPVAAGTILGRLVPEGRDGPVLATAFLLLAVVLALTGFMLPRSAALLRLQGRMLGRMQSGLWDRLLALPAAFFDRYSVADLAQRLNGVEAIQDTISTTASRTLLAAVTLLFSTGLLFTYGASLALAVVAVIVVVLGLGAIVTAAQVKVLRKTYQAKGRASSVLPQIVKGNEKIHAAGAEDRALGAWAVPFTDQVRMLLASWQWGAARTALYALLPSALTLVVFGVVLSNPGTLSIAAFLTFIAALGQVAAATNQLDQGVSSAMTIGAIFRALEPILAEPPEVSARAADPGPLDGRIALSAVSFRYPGMDRAVLEDVDVIIEPGEFVAFVGRSGSGKSTIVRLLLGLERPDSGSVTYDGKDLQTLDARAVRDQIGVAMQNVNLVGADILSVIAGDRPLTEDQAMDAASRVGLADDIRALPLGLHTRVGDAGETLCGGQRQRIVLAAALARSPRVVILDEATSALDSVSQAVVASSFGSLQVTRIIVAHRLSTIRQADRVIVLDAGRVVQEGTFTQLADEPGFFRDLVRRQTL
jgi:NHLM bacteriocin system ABC transporter ATP-binding protein